jgi:TPR repeat protein
MNSRGLPDRTTSPEYYHLPAGPGDAARNRYRFCLGHGMGIEVRAEEAVKYYRLAADQGHAGGQFNHPACVQCGLGIEANAEEQ